MSVTKKDVHEHEGWIKTTIIAIVVCAIDFAVISVGILSNNTALSIAGVGIVTFFGMLIISSHYAIHQPDSKGTMRKAIAGSLVTVYVVILALSISGKLEDAQNQMVMNLIENFTWIIIAIVGFYFGTKGVTEFLKFWKSPK